MVPFSGLQVDDTVTILKWHGVDPDDAQLFAHLSGGSPGRALLLYKTEIMELWKDIVSVLSVKDSGSGSDLGVVLKLAEKMAGLKDDLDHLLIFLKVWLQELLVACHCRSTLKESKLQFIKDEPGKLKNWNSDQLFAKLQAVDIAERGLARNCNRLLVCEVLLFKLQ